MKIIKILAAIFCLMIIMPTAYAEVSIVIDDKTIAFEDQAPVVVSERVFVPLRKIFEELGAYVTWDADNNSIYAGRRFTNVMFTLGDTKYTVDGYAKELDVAPFAQNNRTLVPLRAVSEAFGAEVVWSGEDGTVYISMPTGAHIVKDRYLQDTLFHQNGIPVMTYNIAYPEILSDEPYVSSFNEIMKSDALDVMTYATGQAFENAIESCDSPYPNLPYSVDVTFDVMYDDFNIVSVLSLYYEYSGGAHGNYIFDATTYNLETGTEVGLSEILGLSNEETQNTIYNFVKSECEKDPDAYFYDYDEYLYDLLSEPQWYFAEDGLHIFFNPYEIAPYSSGVRDFVMPLN